MILPSLSETPHPKLYYSLFPPLGLATLAGYLPGDDVTVVDVHVERVSLDDAPDLVVIQVYVTSAALAEIDRLPGRHSGTPRQHSARNSVGAVPGAVITPEDQTCGAGW